MTTPDQSVLDLIRQEAGRLAEAQFEFLKNLTIPDSGTGNVEGNKRVVETIVEALGLFPPEARPETEIVEAPGVGRHLVIRLGREGAERRALCLAHLDTVFAPGQSAEHPFRQEGDRTYGLGVVDCKGGVAVSLFAAVVAARMGLLPRGWEVALLYTCDEETGSATSRPIFERESKGADYALCFEPARGRGGVITTRKGCAFGKVEIAGRQAHALSAYPSGADANLALALSIARVCGRNDPGAGRFFNFGLISGGVHSDVVSDRARGEFFVTFADRDELDLARGVLASLRDDPPVEGCSIATELTEAFPPMVPTPESLAAYRRAKEIGERLGLTVPEDSSPGSSDGCWVASHGVPVIDALGPYMHDIHTTDESLDTATVRQRTELVAAILASMGDWPARAR